MLGDPSLAPYFDGTDVDKVKQHQVALLSTVSGGPEAYTGRSMEVMVAAAQGADSEPSWWDAEVVSHERRGSDLAVFRVRTQPPLAYEPGSR